MASKIKDLNPYLLRNPTIRSISRVLFSIPVEVVEEEMVAETDGRRIRVGKGMDRYEIKEQAAVMLHEIMHIILMHCSPVRRQGKHPLIWQLVCEPIVNSYITEIKEISDHVKLPDDALTFNGEIFKEARRVKPSLQWTTEELYWWALENFPRSEDGVYVDGKYFKDGRAEGEKIKLPVVGADLIERGNDVEDQIEQERMNQAMRSLAAGCSSESMKQALLRELPKVTIPWDKLLRKVLQNVINSNRLMTNYERPCRHYLAGVGEYEPSVKVRPTYKIGILVDTSGSCFDIETQMLFAGVIESVRKKVRPEIVIVTGDTKVKGEQVIEATNRKPLKEVLKEFIGGGGTSYIESMKRLVSYKPNVIIGLTDGELSEWGDNRKIPTIWVCTTNEVAPYGKTIFLKNHVI